LQERLGYSFSEPELLLAALTHRSWAHERGSEATYERLEFLGDAVLALLTAEWLFRRDEGATEGKLSRRKGFAVSEPVLARHAESLGLGGALLLGVGEERSGGRTKPSLLADVFEAVLGAIFVDGGLNPARQLLAPLLAHAVQSQERLPASDSKSRLQEWAQSVSGDLPEYRLIEEEGPDHQKRFTVECRVGDGWSGSGTGRSKKVAEQRAAASVLAAVGSIDG
jgi:ribonuclease-3